MCALDVRDQIEKEGFAVLRGAFPRPQIVSLGEKMEAELERLASIAPSLPDDMRKSMERSEMPAHDGAARFRLDPLNYAHLTQSSALRDALEAIFEEPYLWHYPTMFRKITPDKVEGFLPFHQDFSYNSHYAHLMTCWVPLNDCGINAPSISIIAENTAVKFEHAAQGAWESGIPEEKLQSLLAKAPIVDIECAAGDLVLFGELTLHRTFFRPTMNCPRFSMDARAVPVSSISGEVRRKRKFVAADRAEVVTMSL